jgi:hypothetical protein
MRSLPLLCRVHWSFDAFKVTASGTTRTPDLAIGSGDKIGGVPLVLSIAEDICNRAQKKANIR